MVREDRVVTPDLSSMPPLIVHVSPALIAQAAFAFRRSSGAVAATPEPRSRTARRDRTLRRGIIPGDDDWLSDAGDEAPCFS